VDNSFKNLLFFFARGCKQPDINHQLYGPKFFSNWSSLSWLTNSSYFIDPEVSLLYSQKLATGVYPEPRTPFYTLCSLFMIYFNFVLSHTPGHPNFSSVQAFRPKTYVRILPHLHQLHAMPISSILVMRTNDESPHCVIFIRRLPLVLYLDCCYASFEVKGLHIIFRFVRLLLSETFILSVAE
jgi:hypothetical protein